ncbi:MAG: hypothetical protein IJB52_00320 [Clostridia bacterium]|nr:hypothetical protein [Clostridia bacterium]
MKKRCLALLFAGVLLSGCGGTQTDIPAETTADTAAEVVETEISYDPMIEAVDCGGRDYTILSRYSDGSNYCYPYHEFLAEEANGEAINDAIFERNAFIEEKYNLVLSLPEEADMESILKKAVTAGDALYDLVNISPQSGYNVSVVGALRNMNNIPHIDITKPYWRASVMENTSTGGKNFFYVGDLNLASLNGVGVVFFNKELADSMQITDLYDTVRSGRWTFDTFTEYCRGVTADVNGDGTMNGEDKFGLTVNGFVWQPFFAGTGSRIIDKDAEDIPVLNWDTEENINAISRIVNFVNDRESVILVNQFPELQTAGGWGQASIDMFSENRALFWIEIIYGVHQLRTMDKDFGILPMPKYDENQKEYASYIHAGWTSAIAMPITNTEDDLAGRLIEDLAYQSSITVRPAFYDVTLKGKVSRDNDSGDMLDIIYSNINLDLVTLMASRLPVDTNMREFLIKNNTSFTSTIASLKQQCETKLQQDAETLIALEH